jgi:hypothetical protein
MVGCTPRVKGYSPGKPIFSRISDPSSEGIRTGGRCNPEEVRNSSFFGKRLGKEGIPLSPALELGFDGHRLPQREV